MEPFAFAGFKSLSVELLVILGVLGLAGLFSRHAPSTAAAGSTLLGKSLKVLIVVSFFLGGGLAFADKAAWAVIFICLGFAGYLALVRLR